MADAAEAGGPKKSSPPKSGDVGPPFRVVEEPRKSDSDRSTYRAVELQNGLKVLLISDPETDKAAAALTVQVGYLSDPTDIPGMAHFCEHMLLLGTSKYPAENHYEEYISTHGGQRNAMTCTDETCYFFDITPDYLRGCLDIFAQFFINPLFDQNCMLREKYAVDSENQKNIKRDPRRLFRINQITSDPKHDYVKFGTGNMDTLSAKGSIELRKHLIAFHSKWYSPNIMSLVIYGRENLDQLTSYAVDMFGPIVNKKVVPQVWTTHPFSEDVLQIEIKVVPVDDIHKLTVTFPTPDISSQYKAKPDCYISHLISQTSQGGLICHLRSLNWVVSGEADLTDGARGICFFKISFNLSSEGIRHTDEIITLLFQYIRLLREKKPQEFIFKELMNLAEMSFRFMPKPHPMRYCQRLSRVIHKYAWRDIMSGPYVYEEFRPELIEQLFSCLVPERMRVMLVSKQFHDEANLVEKHYGVRYSVSKIAAERIDKWKTVQLNDVFKLPAPNNFVATNFKLVDEEKDYTKQPKIITNDPNNRIWYMQDREYRLPRNVISCQIRTPLAFKDALSDALTHLAVNCFRDDISGALYPARVAGLNYSIINHQYGISLKVSGYNERQQFLLETILTRLAGFKVDPGRFGVLKDLYARRLSNFDTKPPHRQAVYYAEVLLCEKFYTHTDTLAVLDKCTPEACSQHLTNLLQNAFIECLVHGNMSSADAKELASTVRRVLKCGPLAEDSLLNLREYHLTEGQTIHLSHTNAVQPAGAVMALYQIGVIDSNDLKTCVLNEILCRLIDEPVFNILRTKEQLGYIVSCETKVSYGTQGLLVLVQSNLPSAYVFERIETFINRSMNRILNELTVERLEDHKRALVALKLAKPKTLEEKTRILWDEVCSRSFLFDRAKLEAEAVKGISKEDVIGFYKRYIEQGAPERKQLIVYIESKETQNAKVQEQMKRSKVDTITLEDVHTFKKDHELFPRERRQPDQMMISAKG